MMRVRCILVETTVPVRIRPRIETRPVKGHFLSVDGHRVSKSSSPSTYVFPSPEGFQFHHRISILLRSIGRPETEFIPPSRTDVVALNGSLGGLEAQTDILVPPLAVLARAGSLDLGLAVEEDCITTTVSTLCFLGGASRPSFDRCIQAGRHSLCGCFWKARSLWTVNSTLAILSV